jgi:TATA-binding protein-associated factor Taf7
LEISKSPNQLNRFDVLQLDDEKQESEIKINNEEISNDDDDEEEEEEDDDDEDEEDEDENLVEQIREDILAYEQSKEPKKKNLSLIVNREELIYLLKCLYIHKTTTRENILTIGMVS